MDKDLENYLQFSPFYAGFELERESLRGKFLSGFQTLPAALKDFLSSAKTADMILNFGRQNNLADHQISSVAAVIRYLLIGQIYIGDLPKTLAYVMQMNDALAIELSRKIVRDILAPVIDDLKKVQLQKFGKLPGLSQQPSQNFAPQNLGGQAPQHIPGEELPETGGNILDLRKTN
jgi:hypothetical protein